MCAYHITIYLSVHLFGMHGCWGAHAMWKNNLQESVPSSYHIGPIDKTLVLKLGSKRFYSVSHLSGSLCALLNFHSNEYDMLFKARQNNIDSDYNMCPAPPYKKCYLKTYYVQKIKFLKILPCFGD